MSMYELSTTQLKRVLEETAARLNLPPTSIEKDWWVSLVLEALYADALGQRLTFKGGTSLSKAFKLINRFSEDIDIVIDRKSLGFSGNHDPECAESRSSRKRLVEELKSECALCVREKITPVLRFQMEQLVGEGPWSVIPDEHDPDKQTLLISYPSLFPESPSKYIENHVKIELGARSGDEPTMIREIRSMSAEVFPHSPWAHASRVRALDPARTFLEKACLIHEENHRPADKPIKGKMSRHLYDLSCLYRAGIGREAFSNHDLLNRVLKNRKTYFFYSWMDYETIKPGSFLFVPQNQRMDFWHQDYDTFKSEMIYGDAPTFTELIEQITEIQTAANGAQN